LSGIRPSRTAATLSNEFIGFRFPLREAYALAIEG
jgi:hypothetical protein